jgi:hypothetical protein
MIRVPDDVLLEIFDFYMIMDPTSGGKAEAWQSLVHVCQRWKNLVFRSASRLNLQLCCTPETPARKTLDVWPALPLIVEGSMTSSSSTDNIIAALGQSNRVREVHLWDLEGGQLEKVMAEMEESFPELTEMRLFSNGNAMRVTSDFSLDGSAPRLRIFESDGISFQSLPGLLLSATHLIELRLSCIPHSWYISTVGMVAFLSALSSLESFSLGFESPRSHLGLGNRSLRLPKRFILPEVFFFEGDIEYLENLVTSIDAPQLNHLQITFFNQIDFETPRLAQFINRAPKLRKREARMRFHNGVSGIVYPAGTRDLEIEMLFREQDWQPSSVEQVFNSPLSMAEGLYIKH